MLAGPRMQAVVPNAVSNRALNNCHSIHGRGEVSSQCHKESTIGCLMNGGQIFFRPFLLQLCFAPLPLIHECSARTFRLMETGLKLPIISAICLLAHSCPGPLCIIAHNSVFVGGTRIQEGGNKVCGGKPIPSSSPLLLLLLLLLTSSDPS